MPSSLAPGVGGADWQAAGAGQEVEGVNPIGKGCAPSSSSPPASCGHEGRRSSATRGSSFGKKLETWIFFYVESPDVETFTQTFTCTSMMERAGHPHLCDHW